MTTNMQIGEAARRTALSVDAIRFYEHRSLLPKPPRTAGRFRLYSDDDVARLDFIKQMQGLGFSLREIVELIELRRRRIQACESVRELLKHKVADIRAKLTELQRLETELLADLEKCNNELKHRQRHAPGACPVLEDISVAATTSACSEIGKEVTPCRRK